MISIDVPIVLMGFLWEVRADARKCQPIVFSKLVDIVKLAIFLVKANVLL